jgi:hypothetical protein
MIEEKNINGFQNDWKLIQLKEVCSELQSGKISTYKSKLK